MGCWNETCAFTLTPIAYAEPVGFTIVKQTNDVLGLDIKARFKESDYNGDMQRFPNRAVYPDQYCQPILPIMFGQYDDYGTVENIQELPDAFKHVTGDYLRLIERGKNPNFGLYMVKKEVFDFLTAKYPDPCKKEFDPYWVLHTPEWKANEAMTRATVGWNRILNRFRRTWLPTSGTGHQWWNDGDDLKNLKQAVELGYKSMYSEED